MLASAGGLRTPRHGSEQNAGAGLLRDTRSHRSLDAIRERQGERGRRGTAPLNSRARRHDDLAVRLALET